MTDDELPIEERDRREICFYRLLRGRRPDWHRVLRYYQTFDRFITYCGRVDPFNSTRFSYAGPWNAGTDIIWRDCQKCQGYYLSS